MTGFQKESANKPMLAYLPVEELELVALGLDYGARKYSRDNWKKGDARTYASAALRHLFAWLKGEVFDKESNLPHISLAICNLLFISWHDRQGRERELLFRYFESKRQSAWIARQTKGKIKGLFSQTTAPEKEQK